MLPIIRNISPKLDLDVRPEPLILQVLAHVKAQHPLRARVGVLKVAHLRSFLSHFAEDVVEGQVTGADCPFRDSAVRIRACSLDVFWPFRTDKDELDGNIGGRLTGHGIKNMASYWCFRHYVFIW